MTTLYGVNATKWVASPAQLAEQGQQKAKIYETYDTYEITADMTGGTDVIMMGRIPAGARVIDCRVLFDDLDGSGGTLDIGWAAGAAGTEAIDADGFLADVDVTSAGVISMWTSQSTRPGLFKTFAEEVQIMVSPDGDTDATSGTITVQVWYCID